jgi:hypothetical protein
MRILLVIGLMLALSLLFGCSSQQTSSQKTPDKAEVKIETVKLNGDVLESVSVSHKCISGCPICYIDARLNIMDGDETLFSNNKLPVDAGLLGCMNSDVRTQTYQIGKKLERNKTYNLKIGLVISDMSIEKGTVLGNDEYAVVVCSEDEAYSGNDCVKKVEAYVLSGAQHWKEKATTLRVRAESINWNSDSEDDGLRININILDSTFNGLYYEEPAVFDITINAANGDNVYYERQVVENLTEISEYSNQPRGKGVLIPFDKMNMTGLKYDSFGSAQLKISVSALKSCNETISAETTATIQKQ